MPYFHIRYTPGNEVIPYNVSVPQNFRMTSNVVVAVGDTFGWSSVGYTNDRAYAIRIYTDNSKYLITLIKSYGSKWEF